MSSDSESDESSGPWVENERPVKETPSWVNETQKYTLRRATKPEKHTLSEYIRIKLVMMGDGSVGKSTLLQRFVSDRFVSERNMTVRAEVESIPLYIEYNGEQQKVIVDIYDTAGQERFQSCTTSYFRGTDGAMLVFDATKPDSCIKAAYWRQAISVVNRITIGKKEIQSCTVQLVCNKMDLYTKREGALFVGEQWMKGKDMHAYAEEQDCLAGFASTSATYDTPKEHIDDIFLTLVNKAVRHKLYIAEARRISGSPVTGSAIKITEKKAAKKSRCF